MRTGRKHFSAKGSASAFARMKATEGFNVGAVKLPIRGQREWIVFWSAGFLNPGRSRRA